MSQLEAELDLEKAKEQEYIKEIRRLEKRNKDLVDQITDEQLKLMALTDAYDKLQIKMKVYKGQIEGAVRGFLVQTRAFTLNTIVSIKGRASGR